MTQLSPILRQATPVIAVKGDGIYLFDADNRCYIDSPPEWG